jgi:hypothetical protein
MWDADTEMMTGKGEPLLFPHQITEYLRHTKRLEEESGFRFKTKEIQSNGIKIQQKPDVYEQFLKEWKGLGLDTLSVSIVHYEEEPNRKFYVPYQDSYINLGGLIRRVKDQGVKVRLSCIFIKDHIDSPQKVSELIDFARYHQVDELTMRSMSKPDKSENQAVYDWVAKNEIPPEKKLEITDLLWKIGKPKVAFPWGGVVFDVNGQNVCLTNCLSPDTTKGTHRLLVFFASGIIATGWTEDSKILP